MIILPPTRSYIVFQVERDGTEDTVDVNRTEVEEKNRTKTTSLGVCLTSNN